MAQADSTKDQQDVINQLDNTHKKYQKEHGGKGYLPKPPSLKTPNEPLSYGGEGVELGERATEVQASDLSVLMGIAKEVANNKRTPGGKQGFVVTHILQASGFTKDRIQMPMARDLGKPLTENGFTKLDSLDPAKAPAGSVIVMRGRSPRSPGAVYIKGDDGFYYSDSKTKVLPEGRSVIGVYSKVAGASDVLSSDSDERNEQLKTRKNALMQALRL